MHIEEQTGQRISKKKKKKQKKKIEEEEQSKPRHVAAVSSSSSDQVALKLRRKKKRPKMFGEQVYESEKKGDTASHLPCKLEEHNEAQENGVHIDHNAAFDGPKKERKKVRFSDQFAAGKCHQSQSEEVCGYSNSVFEESSANGCEDQACSMPPQTCNKDNSKEVPALHEFMSSESDQAAKATDEKNLLTRKRPRDEDDVIWGKRFTRDEDEILKNAVLEYIKSKGWDEQEGLNKVFNSQKHKEARNCWADINPALPHRPRVAVRYRAHVLLEKGAHAGKWTEEEEQVLRRLQAEHGRKWKEISALIDRHRTSIKEKWRSLKREKGKGVWTQGELQQLSDLVHKCLRAKTLISVERKQLDHHILRDDINWEQIADTIGTHNHGSCCGKWYYNLQSSLVTDGLWANEDDMLLLESLLESGACTEEEVEWDSLLYHRSGQVCSTRWKQMVKHLGENRTQQFLDKLDILTRRYAPELLESSVTESPSAPAKTTGS